VGRLCAKSCRNGWMILIFLQNPLLCDTLGSRKGTIRIERL
jgi:hypothetical protein